MVANYKIFDLSLFVYRSCFISNEDSLSLTSFCRAASVVHPDIRRSKIPDNLWSQFIFEMAENFCQRPDHRKKKMVTCVGRQPGSDIWVFGPELQVDHRGKQIKKDYEEYYWLVLCKSLQ